MTNPTAHLPGTATRFTQEIGFITCIDCGTAFGMTAVALDHRRKDGEPFYCPNGHSQHFIVDKTKESGPTRQELLAEVSDLKGRLVEARQAAELAEARLGSAPGDSSPVAITAGRLQCPHCTRSFSTLTPFQKHLRDVHNDLPAIAVLLRRAAVAEA